MLGGAACLARGVLGVKGIEKGLVVLLDPAEEQEDSAGRIVGVAAGAVNSMHAVPVVVPAIVPATSTQSSTLAAWSRGEGVPDALGPDSELIEAGCDGFALGDGEQH